MTCPMYCWVCSLYCRQNSMMFTPCWPSAVPTGGAGVAWPARIWSLTTASTFFFAILGHLLRYERPPGLPHAGWFLDLRHLVEGELDRRLPVEDVHEHLQLALVQVDLADRAVEVGERSRDDPHHVVLLESEAELRLHLLLLHRQDLLHLTTRERRGLASRPGRDEPRHPGRVPDDVPRVVVVDHLDQEVAGEDLALDDLLLAALDLHDVLHRDVDVEDLVLHLHRVDPRLE